MSATLRAAIRYAVIAPLVLESLPRGELPPRPGDRRVGRAFVCCIADWAGSLLQRRQVWWPDTLTSAGPLHSFKLRRPLFCSLHHLRLATPLTHKAQTPCPLKFARDSDLRDLTQAISSACRTRRCTFFNPGYAPFDQTPEGLRQIILEGAAGHGLTAKKVVIGSTTIFAAFELTQ